MISSKPYYFLFGRQCASSISELLKLDETGYFLLRPESLFEGFIKENKVNCDGLPATRPYAHILKKYDRVE